MKKICLLFALIAFALCGCARHYVITLQNGSRIDARSKPERRGNFYIFKDGQGQDVYISSVRVKEIAPASMANDGNSEFRYNPPK